MSTIHVADPNARAQLPEAEVQRVSVIHLDQTIGSGELASAAERMDITGSYNWPPDSIALVEFSVRLKLLSDNTCNVELDFPGLYPAKVGPVDAGCIVLLLMGRPQILITTPTGDHVTVTYVGPFGDPGITTGVQVAVANGAGTASTSLLFQLPNAGS